MGVRSRWSLAVLAAAVITPAVGADLALPGPTLYNFEGRPMIRGPALPGTGCRVPVGRESAPTTITNAPCDPTYVGSAYGLGRPSRDGLVPGPGFDDPYDRPLARRR